MVLLSFDLRMKCVHTSVGYSTMLFIRAKLCCMHAEEDVKKLHDRVGKVVHASHSDTEPTDAEKRALAATLIQAHYRGHVVRQAMKHYRIGGQLSEVLELLQAP